jgi:hypothetical protein
LRNWLKPTVVKPTQAFSVLIALSARILSRLRVSKRPDAEFFEQHVGGL